MGATAKSVEVSPGHVSAWSLLHSMPLPIADWCEHVEAEEWLMGGHKDAVLGWRISGYVLRGDTKVYLCVMQALSREQAEVRWVGSFGPWEEVPRPEAPGSKPLTREEVTEFLQQFRRPESGEVVSGTIVMLKRVLEHFQSVLPFTVTAADVEKERIAHDCSLMEAKRYAEWSHCHPA